MKNKIKKISYLFSIGLVLILFGITYSFFVFTSYSNQIVSTSGEVYLKMNKDSNNIVLNSVFPESYNEALYVNGEDGTLRTDNIIEFTVIGKNEYKNPVYYEIDLEYGEDINNKIRILDKHLKFELLDITNPNDINEIISDISYESINNLKIYVDTISDTDVNYSKTYRLRMWIDENIIVSDTNLEADYKASNNTVDLQNQDLILFSDLFASIKIRIYGDFIEKTNPNGDTPATCFTYTNNGSSIALNRYTKTCGDVVNIPKMIDGLPVTTIETFAFIHANNITSVKIPNTITTIEGSAFCGCSKLKNLKIPASVTNINGSIVSDADALTSIVVDPNNPVYDSRNNCNAIIRTSSNALIQGCKNTVIPDDIVILGNNAFDGNKELTNINIPSSVRYFEARVFTDCRNLENINLPANLTTIEMEAFEDCESLKSIFIPASVTYIGIDLDTNPFSGCSSLTSIIVDPNNTVYDSRNNCNAIIETSTNVLFSGCKNTIIPNTVTTISGYEFSYMTGLTSITIPSSVTSIGERAFVECTALSNITFSNGLTSIGDFAFSDCNSLTNLTLPNSLISIGEYAFSLDYSNNLTSLTIPSSVTSIGDKAFADFQNVSDIYVNWNDFSNVNLGEDLFYYVYSLNDINLHVPSGTRSLYSNDELWGQFNIIEG